MRPASPGRPRAAPMPGRAAPRQIIAFQTARVAGRRKGASVGLPPPRVLPVPWSRLGYPVAFPAGDDLLPGRATDLHALVELAAKAAHEAAWPRGRSPWLEPLPALISLDQLPVPVSGHEPHPLPFGLEDRPAEQSQPAAVFDLAAGAHLAVAGAARSGRSTLLRTLAASLARSLSPADVHIYGLDFGNGALLPLASLPHCGAIVARSEGDRVERLLTRLIEELIRRQDLMAQRAFGDIAEQRTAAEPANRLPYLVLFIDRWEGFMAAYPIESGSRLPAEVGRLLREGPGAGIRLVLSGDRSLLTDRLVSQVEDRLVLRLNDRDDYRLANINPREVAADIPPGRALRAESGIELQVAVLDSSGVTDPGSQAQAEAVRVVADAAVQRWPEPRLNRPIRVDTLPASLGTSGVAELVRAGRSDVPESIPTGSLWAVVGVGGDELRVRGVDLAASRGFVVAGPARSGRSSALLVMVRSLASAGGSAVVICPRPSPLAEAGGLPGIVVLAGRLPGPADVVDAIRSAGAAGPVALFVDDADTFARSETDDAVRRLLREDGDDAVPVVVAGPIEEMKTELRGVVAEARRARSGLLLSPASTFDGDLVGVRLAQSMIGRMPPGRGFLVAGGDPLLVQVPLD